MPTLAESGLPGFEIDQWYGVITTAKVSPAIVNKRSDAGIAEGIKSHEVAQRLAGEVSTAVGNTPEQFSAHIRAETGKWRKVLKETGLIIN